jgi:hypothetical protein
MYSGKIAVPPGGDGIREFLNIETRHNKTQQSQNVEARRR